MAEFKVLIADALSPTAFQRLQAGGVQTDDRAGIDAAELAKILPDYHALIVRSRTKVTVDLLQNGKNLKVVGRAGVGVDNIDVSAAKEKGVAVVNTPVATSIAVAEHTFALILALIRQIARADASMKGGQWDKKNLEGTELAGKTLGILGVGNIGAQVAKRAAAFEMQVIGYDPLLDATTLHARGAKAAALDELYAQSDVITLHLPLFQETRGMLGAKEFAKMKRGVYLICAARGGVIDEEDLVTALDSGRVAGAALDVFEKEPPGANPLITHPHVVATPHIAAQTAEAQERAALDIADEVLNALHGRPLRWQIK